MEIAFPPNASIAGATGLDQTLYIGFFTAWIIGIQVDRLGANSNRRHAAMAFQCWSYSSCCNSRNGRRSRSIFDRLEHFERGAPRLRDRFVPTARMPPDWIVPSSPSASGGAAARTQSE
jgi:hypothetical protein